MKKFSTARAKFFHSKNSALLKFHITSTMRMLVMAEGRREREEEELTIVT
jgi:hypothetical protein